MRETLLRRKSSSNDIMKLGPHRMAYLKDKNLNYHTQIIGGSVSEKTNLLKVMIEDRVRKKTGEALLVSTKVDTHFCIMKIDLAEEYSSEYE
jgi:hypothetical protein